MPVDFRDINGSIKYNVINRRVKTITDMIALICAIIYPFRKVYGKDSNSQLDKRISRLKLMLYECDNDLLRYSFEGLVSYFRNEFVGRLTTLEKIQFLDIFDGKCKYDINSNTFELTYNDVISNSLLATYEGKEYIYDGYGNDAYESETGVVEVSAPYDDMDSGTITDVVVSPASKPDSTEELDNIALKGHEEHSPISDKDIDTATVGASKANRIIANSVDSDQIQPLVKLFDKLIETRSGRSDYNYVWQWKISNGEYIAIKDEITTCKVLEAAYKSNIKCLKLLVIYIAEYYKREWNANDKEENILTKLGLQANNSSASIANAYFGENSPKVYHYEGERRRTVHEWLDALYVEGGLPIQYIINKLRNNVYHPLVQFADKVYDDPDEAIKIFESLHKTFQYSYSNGHSIKCYIDTLLNEKYIGVCSQYDIERVEIFKQFNELLENGKEKRRRESNKFAYKYRVWKFYNEFVLYRSIILKEDRSYNEKQELISRDRIRDQWKVSLGENDIFHLEIGGRKYTFHPWTSQFYRSVNGLVEFSLPTTTCPNCEKSYDKVYFIGPDGERHEISSIVKSGNNDYLRFTSNDGYEWVTGASRELSAVLVSPESKIELYHSEIDMIVGNNLRWIEFDDKIKIDNKFVHARDHEIDIDDAKHAVVKQKDIRSFSYYNDGQRIQVPFLDAFKINKKNLRHISRKNNATAVRKIEYIKAGATRYVDYPTNPPFPLGYTKLRVDGICFDAYLLSNDLGIKRKSQRQVQSDKGIICIEGLQNAVAANGYEVREVNGRYEIEDHYTSDNNTRESIPFYIHISEDEYLLVDVIRPLYRQDKIINGKPIDVTTSVPMKLESQYRRRVFDTDGVKYFDDRKSQKEYSSEIGYYRGNYFIANGRNISSVEDNLEFVFISTNGREQKLTLETKELDRQGQYLCFNNLSASSEGVIIQSLQHTMPKLTYYKPRWIPERQTEKINALERLKLTIKHKLYFNVLFPNGISPEVMTNFFDYYCDECDKRDKQLDWEFLWNLSKEINKDWICIHREHWRRVANDNRKKQLVGELFSNVSNIDPEKLSRFVEVYWDIDMNKCVYGPGKRTDVQNFILSVFANGKSIFTSMPDIDKLNLELDKIMNK